MRYNKMIEMNKVENKRKTEAAKKEIKKMLENKERITVTELVKRTGFSKGFFYRNPDVRDTLDGAKKQQGVACYNPRQAIIDQAMEDKIIHLKIGMLKLKKEIKKLEQENDELQKSNELLTVEVEELKSNN